MNQPKRLGHAILALVVAGTVSCGAMGQNAAPLLITYQGELRSPTTGEPVPDGSYNMLFRIYDVESGGAPLWEGTHTDTNGNPVGVTAGIFSVILGSGSGNTLDPSVFNGADRWLEIRVGAERPSPSHRITSAAYSIVSENARLLGRKQVSEFAQSTHSHSGSDITSGVVLEGWIDSAVARDAETSAAISSHAAIAAAHHTWTTSFSEFADTASDSQIPGSIARDSEIMPTVLAGDGPGSTLNADYLDGNDSSASVPSGHTHDSRYWGLAGNSRTNPATHFLGTADNQPLEMRVNNVRILRLEPNATSPNIIAGYGGNAVTAGVVGATIAGGGLSGFPNSVTDDYGTIGGGANNRAGDSAGTTTDAPYATVGGGWSNEATGEYATVGGGRENTASGNYATVGGGYSNTAAGHWATAAGGSGNSAQGDYSFAAGRRAKANYNGCFVWGDSTDGDIATSGPNRFAARASGGVWFYSSSTKTTGVRLPAGDSAWTNVSDRALKENICQVDGQEILRKLIQVPISRWSYKGQTPGIEHIGPMAQDSYAAFGLGDDERYISTIDPDGVALAAIQGLHEIVKEKDERMSSLEKKNMELERRLKALEELVKKLTDHQGGQQ